MFDPAFLKGATWGFPDSAVEHVETHAAHVFLVADSVFKIKKNVKLPYLDFSTAEKRRRVLEDEIAINRRFAPDLYVEVRDVHGEPALVMRRFPAQALLSWMMSHGTIDSGLARRLAQMAAQSHDVAERRDVAGAGIMAGLGEQLARAFSDSPDLFRGDETLEFLALFEEALARLKRLLNQRSEQGLVRRCHGDMHSGNIIVESGRPTLFDAIEFSEKIATIDVLYDLAFLLVDLWTHDEKAAANTILNAYLDLRRDHEDLSGLALLPLFLSTRAGVRALVTADLVHELPLSSSLKPRGQALDWFRAALGFLKPPKPALICIGGLSGTGKSTAAAGLAHAIGAPPGALHVRSDVERKRLAGVAETERLPVQSYSPQSSAAVYQACRERAERALQAGHSVVVDAVFAREAERGMFEAAAASCNAEFQGIWLEAPAGVLKSRVAARTGDASDATPEVVDRQIAYDLGTIAWSKVDASAGISEVLARIRQTLRIPPGGQA